MDRNKKILCALLVLLGLSLTYRLFHPYEQKEVNTLKFGTVAHERAIRKTPENQVNPNRSPEVKWSLLENPAARLREVIRNPFSEEVQANAVKRSDSEPERVEAEPTRPAAPDPMETVNRELGQMKVFGYYESLGLMKLFVERGREILVISEGDKIDGKYLVKEIGSTRVTLRAEHIGQDVHIDLSGM